MLDIDVIVVEFGYWATPRYETEFPRVAAGFAEMKCDARYAEKYRTRPISDELGMLIDGHLQVMKLVTPELFDIFILTYVKRWDRAEILQYLNLSRREYFNRLKTAKMSLLLMLASGGEMCVWEV